MPQYLYKKPNEELYVEITQSMSEVHRFIDKDGLEWKRVWQVPHAIVKSVSNMNPFNIREHVEKTGNMKGSVGNLWDISREMSEKRSEKIGGEDPIKREYFNNYEKENKTKHFADKKTKFETKDAIVDISNPFKLPDTPAFKLPVSGGD